MAFTASGVFKAFVHINGLRDPDNTAATNYVNLQADTVKAALYNNTGTPDKDAVVTSTGYNTGAWVVANEVSNSTWTAAGVALTSKAITAPTNAVMFDAADVAPGGTVTLSNVYGCLVYDDSITGGTVADQGVCFNYFGGPNSVSGGTFTVVWHANGIFRITV